MSYFLEILNSFSKRTGRSLSILERSDSKVNTGPVVFSNNPDAGWATNVRDGREDLISLGFSDQDIAAIEAKAGPNKSGAVAITPQGKSSPVIYAWRMEGQGQTTSQQPQSVPLAQPTQGSQASTAKPQMNALVAELLPIAQSVWDQQFLTNISTKIKPKDWRYPIVSSFLKYALGYKASSPEDIKKMELEEDRLEGLLKPEDLAQEDKQKVFGNFVDKNLTFFGRLARLSVFSVKEGEIELQTTEEETEISKEALEGVAKTWKSIFDFLSDYQGREISDLKQDKEYRARAEYLLSRIKLLNPESKTKGEFTKKYVIYSDDLQWAGVGIDSATVHALMGILKSRLSPARASLQNPEGKVNFDEADVAEESAATKQFGENFEKFVEGYCALSIVSPELAGDVATDVGELLETFKRKCSSLIKMLSVEDIVGESNELLAALKLAEDVKLKLGTEEDQVQAFAILGAFMRRNPVFRNAKGVFRKGGETMAGKRQDFITVYDSKQKAQEASNFSLETYTEITVGDFKKKRNEYKDTYKTFDSLVAGKEDNEVLYLMQPSIKINTKSEEQIKLASQSLKSQQYILNILKAKYQGNKEAYERESAKYLEYLKTLPGASGKVLPSLEDIDASNKVMGSLFKEASGDTDLQRVQEASERVARDLRVLVNIDSFEDGQAVILGNDKEPIKQDNLSKVIDLVTKTINKRLGISIGIDIEDKSFDRSKEVSDLELEKVVSELYGNKAKEVFTELNKHITRIQELKEPKEKKAALRDLLIYTRNVTLKQECDERDAGGKLTEKAKKRREEIAIELISAAHSSKESQSVHSFDLDGNMHVFSHNEPLRVFLSKFLSDSPDVEFNVSKKGYSLFIREQGNELNGSRLSLQYSEGGGGLSSYININEKTKQSFSRKEGKVKLPRKGKNKSLSKEAVEEMIESYLEKQKRFLMKLIEPKISSANFK